MTAPVLDLAELAARVGVPVDTVRRYAEAGLLPPAHRDGDRYGYPPGAAHTTRLLAGAERLGVDDAGLAAVAHAGHDGSCATARDTLGEVVAARLAAVEGRLAEQLGHAAAQPGGSAGWAEATRASVPAAHDVARLQAVTGALAAVAHDGPCGDGCGCAAALDAPGDRYLFPRSGPRQLACDLAADGGDMGDRVGVWQQVLARAERREPLPDTPAGLLLRFPLDAGLAATLARLAAAEYRCCSFGSYTIVIDGAGLRLEVRMPDDAAGMLAAVFGAPTAAGA